MTSSNGNIFRVTAPLCGEFTGPGEFPAQRPVTQNFDVFFDLHPNKRLSKQPWGWWFETPSWSWWRQCNGFETPARYNVWIKGCVSSSTFGMGRYWQVQTKWERYVNILAITFILNFLPLMSNIISIVVSDNTSCDACTSNTEICRKEWMWSQIWTEINYMIWGS